MSEPIQVSEEPWVPRAIPYCLNSCEDRFTKEIRNRDRKCVISGSIISEANIQADNWTCFEAADIFPSEQESL